MNKFIFIFIKKIILCFFIFFIFSFLNLFAGDTPSVPGTKVYFINLKDGDTVTSPFIVKLGLTNQMGIAPALADWPDTGHHHIIIDAPSPDPNKAIKKNHIHLNLGQTEITIKLKPGKHTLQTILGDYSHIPHDPVIMSDIINITVK